MVATDGREKRAPLDRASRDEVSALGCVVGQPILYETELRTNIDQIIVALVNNRTRCHVG
jgi:hypothetical protein